MNTTKLKNTNPSLEDLEHQLLQQAKTEKNGDIICMLIALQTGEIFRRTRFVTPQKLINAGHNIIMSWIADGSIQKSSNKKEKQLVDAYLMELCEQSGSHRTPIRDLKLSSKQLKNTERLREIRSKSPSMTHKGFMAQTRK